MTLEDRERRLLELVDEHREGECRRLLKRAEEEARALVRQAYGNARRRAGRLAAAERLRARGRIEAAKAEKATRDRMSRERRQLALLETAWPRLEAALLRRWRQPADRRRWLEQAMDLARRVLPGPLWSIRHAADVGPDEQAALAGELAPGLVQPPEVRPDLGIRAGLVIRSGDAVLDATLDALLADRRSLEARLLAILMSEDRP